MHAPALARCSGLRSGWRWAVATALTLCVLAVGIGNAQPAHSAVVGDCTSDSNWGTLNNAYADQVLALVNQHRVAMGLNALVVSPTLTKSANWKSLHMAYYRYMAHDDPAPPVGRTTGDRLQTCGYPVGSVGWGENIAYGYATPDAVMSGWLNSAGHRGNIENASYRAIGIGVARASNGTYYWTQNFGTLADGGSTNPPPNSTPPAAKRPNVTFTQTPRNRQSSAPFAWTVANAPTSVTCALDGAPVTPCTSPLTFTGLKRGLHNFAVTAANSAGSDTARYSWSA